MVLRTIGLLFVALLADACGDTSSSDPLCVHRTGGALITLGMGAETLTVWSTDEAFISEAQAGADGGPSRIAFFERLLDGRDCDSHWTWHVDPGER